MAVDVFPLLHRNDIPFTPNRAVALNIIEPTPPFGVRSFFKQSWNSKNRGDPLGVPWRQ